MLVVDDDPLIREVVIAILDDGSSSIVEAASGIAALDQAAACAPDVIVLDMMMPGMSGLEVCRELRRNPAFDQTAVVMLTAVDSPTARDDSIACGADAFITKPFSALDLLGTISEAVKRVTR
ncbi:MAG: response regulator transcription factor [Actinomycetota bacterium]